MGYQVLAGFGTHYVDHTISASGTVSSHAYAIYPVLVQLASQIAAVSDVVSSIPLTVTMSATSDAVVVPLRLNLGTGPEKCILESLRIAQATLNSLMLKDSTFLAPYWTNLDE